MLNTTRVSIVACAIVVALLTSCSSQSYGPDVASGPRTAFLANPAPPSAGMVTVSMSGSCASGNLRSQLRAALSIKGVVVTGKATFTGGTKARTADNNPNMPGETYSEVSISIDEVIAGKEITPGSSVTAYVPGGTRKGTVTVIDEELESGFSVDGQFFGTLQPDPDFGYLLQAVPYVNGAAVFPTIGCWNPEGVGAQTKSLTFWTVNNGSSTQKSAQVPVVPMTIIKAMFS